MSEVSDISSMLKSSLLLPSLGTTSLKNNLNSIQSNLSSLPSILNESALTKFTNGGYEVTLKEYTNMSTYSTTMSALFGNNSASKFQNTLNIITNAAENGLANAKSFIQTMKENGISEKTAVKTYSALQKYSLMSSMENYNFIKTTI